MEVLLKDIPRIEFDYSCDFKRGGGEQHVLICSIGFNGHTVYTAPVDTKGHLKKKHIVKMLKALTKYFKEEYNDITD